MDLFLLLLPILILMSLSGAILILIWIGNTPPDDLTDEERNKYLD